MTPKLSFSLHNESEAIWTEVLSVFWTGCELVCTYTYLLSVIQLV